jgi:hypothetical protein
MMASTPHTIRKMPTIHRTKSGHIKTKTPATMANTPMAIPLMVILFFAINLNLLQSGFLFILLIFSYAVNICGYAIPMYIFLLIPPVLLKTKAAE